MLLRSIKVHFEGSSNALMLENCISILMCSTRETKGPRPRLINLINIQSRLLALIKNNKLFISANEVTFVFHGKLNVYEN